MGDGQAQTSERACMQASKKNLRKHTNRSSLARLIRLGLKGRVAPAGHRAAARMGRSNPTELNRMRIAV